MKRILSVLGVIALTGFVWVDSRCCAQSEVLLQNSQKQLEIVSIDGDSKSMPAQVYEDEKHQKLYERIYKKLGKMRPANSKERSEHDCFIVGTAIVVVQSAHADVCFQTVQSQEASAKHIVDFISRSGEGEIFRWRVFGRADSPGTADQLLASIRTQYEQEEAYRNALMAQYQARSIRRC